MSNLCIRLLQLNHAFFEDVWILSKIWENAEVGGLQFVEDLNNLILWVEQIDSNSWQEDNVATDTSYHFVRCGNLRNKSLSAPPILEIIPLAMSSVGFSSDTIGGGGVQYISTTENCPINYGKLIRHHQFQI